METITLNLLAKVRRVTRNRKTWLVAPATILVPGVLPGSKGALFYPESEVTANPGIWNNIPITANHPTHPINGEALSAKDRGVLERQGIGILQNDRVKGRNRLVDCWFDEERVRKKFPEVYNRLLKGQPAELSTGLYTENETAPPGAAYNGRSYEATARRYKPDHLAVLLAGQRGACSLEDGCGVLVNSRKPVNRLEALALLRNKLAANAKDAKGHGSEKSKGHVGFLGEHEYYKSADGNLYRAPIGAVIDLDTGNRIGRWEAPPHLADHRIEMLGLTTNCAGSCRNGKQPCPT